MFLFIAIGVIVALLFAGLIGYIIAISRKLIKSYDIVRYGHTFRSTLFVYLLIMTPPAYYYLAKSYIARLALWLNFPFWLTVIVWVGLFVVLIIFWKKAFSIYYHAVGEVAFTADKMSVAWPKTFSWSITILIPTSYTMLRKTWTGRNYKYSDIRGIKTKGKKSICVELKDGESYCHFLLYYSKKEIRSIINELESRLSQLKQLDG